MTKKICPHCKNENIIKYGKHPIGKGENATVKQKYYCKNCKKYFFLGTNRAKYSQLEKLMLALFLEIIQGKGVGELKLKEFYNLAKNRMNGVEKTKIKTLGNFSRIKYSLEERKPVMLILKNGESLEFVKLRNQNFEANFKNSSLSYKKDKK